MDTFRLRVASLSMIERSYFASETLNHLVVFGLFLRVTWKLGSQLQKGQSGKLGKRQVLKWKWCHLLHNWIFLLLAKLT
ncbi:hypothetical protein CRYUN_Cryun05aG0200000 [Craigia yunnanensis]